MPANMGFPTPPPSKDQDFMAKLTAMLGGPQGVLNFGGSLLAASGPSQQRTSLGQALGGSLLQNQQFQQQQQDSQLKQLLMMSQIQKAKQQQQQKFMNVGAGGTVIDPATGKVIYSNPAKASEGPANWEEWLKYNALPPDEKKEYLEMKRNQNALQLVDVAGGKQIFNKASGALQGVTTAEQEGAGAGAIANAAAIGKATGEATGGQAAKAPAQASMDYIIGEFDKQLPETAQGGPFGVVGKVGGVFNYKDAQRFDNLREQLSTELRTVYRIPGEGTLSDREQAQYGIQLPSRDNHPDVNRAILNDLRQRTNLRLQTPVGNSPPAPTVKRRKFNPATGKIE